MASRDELRRLNPFVISIEEDIQHLHPDAADLFKGTAEERMAAYAHLANPFGGRTPRKSESIDEIEHNTTAARKILRDELQSLHDAINARFPGASLQSDIKKQRDAFENKAISAPSEEDREDLLRRWRTMGGADEAVRHLTRYGAAVLKAFIVDVERPLYKMGWIIPWVDDYLDLDKDPAVLLSEERSEPEKDAKIWITSSDLEKRIAPLKRALAVQERSEPLEQILQSLPESIKQKINQEYLKKRETVSKAIKKFKSIANENINAGSAIHFENLENAIRKLQDYALFLAFMRVGRQDALTIAESDLSAKEDVIRRLRHFQDFKRAFSIL